MSICIDRERGGEMKVAVYIYIYIRTAPIKSRESSLSFLLLFFLRQCMQNKLILNHAPLGENIQFYLFRNKRKIVMRLILSFRLKYCQAGFTCNLTWKPQCWLLRIGITRNIKILQHQVMYLPVVLQSSIQFLSTISAWSSFYIEITCLNHYFVLIFN